MSAPLSSEARLWRVLVIANSMSTIVPGRTSRLEGPYPEVLELLLRDAGINAEVRNAGREYELIDDGVHRYQEQERAWSPDVLVVNFGMLEAQAPVIPKGVHNHFMTWRTGLSRPAALYRRRVAPRLWRGLRQYQRWAMERLRTRTFRVSPRRFEGELRRVIAMARNDHRLVLVVDINPAGPRIAHNMPGIDERRDQFNTLLRDVVHDAGNADPDVRLIAASKLADEMGIDVAIPDGYHWSPPAHRRVAEMLAAEIVPWIKSL